MPSRFSIDRDIARRLVTSFKDQRILIIGDIMIDKYIYTELRSETDESGRRTPKFRAAREEILLGGAGCVATNVRHLGADATIIGVTGADSRRDELIALLQHEGIDHGAAGGTTTLISEPTTIQGEPRPTTLKARLIEDAAHLFRCDIEVDDTLSDETCALVCETIAQQAPSANAIIIADYDKGVMNAQTIDAAMRAAKDAKIPAFVDPKHRNFWRYRGATLVKPNRVEFERNQGVPLRSKQATTHDIELGQIIDRCRRSLPETARRMQVDNVLLTLGSDGMALYRRDKTTSGSPRDALLHLPALNRSPVDVVGAGDSVIATLAIAAAAGSDLATAAALATIAASFAVRRPGARPARLQDLIDWLESDEPLSDTGL
ncbi:bifunctional heptose 7-phosphate kinase/heptose 1-phosphate adenyltransferase [Engelhardtia mirabilis]